MSSSDNGEILRTRNQITTGDEDAAFLHQLQRPPAAPDVTFSNPLPDGDFSLKMDLDSRWTHRKIDLGFQVDRPKMELGFQVYRPKINLGFQVDPS